LTSIDIGAFQYSTGIPINPLSPTKPTSSSGSSPKLVVGTKTSKPSAGSASKLHAVAKSKAGHAAQVAKAKGRKHPK
jgi:hypothetical protein